jgi:isocitrate/isopropylmalate dehydrogenase
MGSVRTTYRILLALLITTSPGPEVVAEAVKVLKTVFAASSEVELKLETHLFGGCAIDETGEALPASTLQACKEADAILMGKEKCESRRLISTLNPSTSTV